MQEFWLREDFSFKKNVKKIAIAEHKLTTNHGVLIIISDLNINLDNLLDIAFVIQISKKFYFISVHLSSAHTSSKDTSCSFYFIRKSSSLHI
jgi:hypothetical protein